MTILLTYLALSCCASLLIGAGMSAQRYGYKDSRGGFIWPRTVLCEHHITQERMDDIVSFMLACNTTAYPVKLTDSDAEPCTVCEVKP